MSKSYSDYLLSSQQLPRAPCDGTLHCTFALAKSDDEKRLVFGWASVAERVDGETVVDWQDDIVEIDELEAAAYDFVQFYREGSDMHERGGFDIAVLIESVVFTAAKLEALGIPAGTVPHGWWIGMKCIDDDVWARVKDGTYSMLSIEGNAIRTQAESEVND